MLRAALRLLAINLFVFPLYLLLLMIPAITLLAGASYISPDFGDSSLCDAILATWILCGIALWIFVQFKMVNLGFGIIESFRIALTEIKVGLKMAIGN
jgi:hypothetical protein